MAFRTFRTDLINLSQVPPWCDPVGGLKTYFISFWRRTPFIWAWFQPLMASFSSCSPPIKFVPLFDRVSRTWPRLAMNCQIALIKESVSREGATWIAHIAKQVNLPALDLKRSKLVHTDSGEWSFIWTDPVNRKICHQVAPWGSSHKFLLMAVPTPGFQYLWQNLDKM